MARFAFSDHQTPYHTLFDLIAANSFTFLGVGYCCVLHIVPNLLDLLLGIKAMEMLIPYIMSFTTISNSFIKRNENFQKKHSLTMKHTILKISELLLFEPK